jgi:hypothetical protein
VVAWFVTLLALWFAFAGQGGRWPVLWGVLLAGVATIAGQAAARRGLNAGPVRLRWLAQVPGLAWQVLVDFALVSRLLAHAIRGGERGSTGRFVTKPGRVRGDDPDADAWSGWLTIAATYSPNAYVIDADPVTGAVLLHDLRVDRASEAPA